MLRYALLRFVQAPVVLLVLCAISFALVRGAKGGPFDSERALAPEVKATLDEKYGLADPAPVQFARWLARAATGDLGPSLKLRSQSVNEIVGRTLRVSATLGGAAIVLALLAGVAVGVVAAARRAGFADRTVMAAAMLGISVPSFVIAPLLVLVFSMRLGWLPPAGWYGLGAVSYALLPVVALALPFAARIARLTRAGMLEVLSQDFIRTARAKGLGETTILLRHGLRGGIAPVVSYLGPALADVLTGTMVIEQVFQIPGLGSEFVQSALNRDQFLVMGTVLTYGVILIACNLLADLMLGLLDPRVRYA